MYEIDFYAPWSVIKGWIFKVNLLDLELYLDFRDSVQVEVGILDILFQTCPKVLDALCCGHNLIRWCWSVMSVMAKSPLLMDLRPGKGQQVLPAIPRGLYIR